MPSDENRTPAVPSKSLTVSSEPPTRSDPELETISEALRVAGIPEDESRAVIVEIAKRTSTPAPCHPRRNSSRMKIPAQVLPRGSWQWQKLNRRIAIPLSDVPPNASILTQRQAYGWALWSRCYLWAQRYIVPRMGMNGSLGPS